MNVEGTEMAFGVRDRSRKGGDLVFVQIALVYLSCSTVSDLAIVKQKWPSLGNKVSSRLTSPRQDCWG